MSVIDQIDKAVAVIPRGALFKTPFGPINVNRTFEGKFSSQAQSDTCLGVQGNLREGITVATSLGRNCRMSLLDPDSFMPELRECLATWVWGCVRGSEGVVLTLTGV